MTGLNLVTCHLSVTHVSLSEFRVLLVVTFKPAAHSMDVFPVDS